MLFKWKSSLFKMCCKELGFLMVLYVTLSIVYRLSLGDDSKRYLLQFDRVLHCSVKS